MRWGRVLSGVGVERDKRNHKKGGDFFDFYFFILYFIVEGLNM